jgi:hypothetical protein
MSSMDSAGGAPGYEYEQTGHAPDGASGVCTMCGRSLPPADLEAVAAEIDQTLSLETGKMVARTAWAGRPPDGVVDALLSFMPGAKARRKLWERGQHLWAEQMTAAMSGPCADCQQADGGYAPAQQAAGDYAPAATIMQPNAGPAYNAGPSTPPHASPYDPDSASPYDSGTAMMQPEPAAAPSPAASPTAYQSTGPSDPYDGPATTAFRPYRDTGDVGTAPPDDDAATSAVPAFLRDIPPGPPLPDAVPGRPAPISDEHESHTVMFAAPLNLRPTAAASKLVVLEGPVHGRQFTMNRPATTIGRSIGCHVTVEDDAVAYDHARIVRGDDGWRVEEVSGGGDLFVNDTAVNGVHPLRSGDVIRVGPARLRFESAS